MKKFLMLIAFGALWSGSAMAQTKQEIKDVEDYLNSIKTMEARFVQTASNGNASEGMLYISKPNKIRMEYDDPVSVLIVGDGNYIIYNDKELDQVTHIDYDDIPATMILANTVNIDGKNLKISDFYKDAGSTKITLKHSKSDIGPITLTFSNSPFELKQWSVIDPQSVEVTVSLYDVRKDADLNSNLFKFKKTKSSPLNYRKK